MTQENVSAWEQAFEQAYDFPSGDDQGTPCFDNVSAIEAFCTQQENEALQEQRAAIRAAASASVQDWWIPAVVISISSIIIELVILGLVLWLRRRRQLQATGIGFMASIIFGCIFGHIASMMDGLEASGPACRGRLALIYLYLYGLIAPIFARLVSLCVVLRNVMVAEFAIAWDWQARRLTMGLLSLQVPMPISRPRCACARACAYAHTPHTCARACARMHAAHACRSPCRC